MKKFDQLTLASYNFKLKGSRELVFNLGYEICHDIISTLCMDPMKYIDRKEESYFQYFKRKPDQRHWLSLQKRDYPEIDITPFLLREGGIEIYQFLIEYKEIFPSLVFRGNSDFRAPLQNNSENKLLFSNKKQLILYGSNLEITQST